MNNNLFSKTLKTFLTSVFISLFVFGSFYFLLSSEPKTEEIKVSEKKTTPKLVMNEKKEESTAVTSKNSQKETEVLGATANSENLIAQLQNEFQAPSTTNLISPIPTTTAAAVTITSTPVPATTPVAAITTPTGTRVATGVPTTGSESLYLLIAAFSLISGFLIVNGKSLAMKNFERI